MKDIKYDENGLIPAIVQDFGTKKVLMLAYMNEESLNLTIKTNSTWFYSRSRKGLWNKGETSGNTQSVRRISYDCDGDTLLIEVNQKGPACHTGNYSCFFNVILDNIIEDDELQGIIYKLAEVIRERRVNPKEGSYTNYLLDKGLDKILKKVGEEASEIIIASKNPEKNELVYEICDLVYHLMVLLEIKDIDILDIKKELFKRYK
ncbi:MAG: bifunctional phosphoribosyl-AMP cyclohydrolase/phosphoribosyl-ATP diphosphatase HisIE [Eubacteriales bacterium]